MDTNQIKEQLAQLDAQIADLGSVKIIAQICLQPL